MSLSQDSKISIILPTFNAEKYLEKTIFSIISQNYKNFELIIVDNKSIDNTINIVHKFKKKINLKIINKKTKNLAEALNLGIGVSNGKYIARIDADDLIRKNRFVKQVEFLENNLDYDIVGTNALRFKNNSFFIKPFIIEYNDVLLKISMIFNSPFIHPSVMIRKKFIVQNNIKYNIKYDECEDYELWYSILEKTKFKNLKYYGIYYRVHRQSASFKNRDKLNNFFKITNKEYLIKLNINLSDYEYNILRKISLLDINKKDNFDNLNFYYIRILKKIENALSNKYDKRLIYNFLQKKYCRFCIRSIQSTFFCPSKLKNNYFKINTIFTLFIYFLYILKIRI